MKLSWRCGLPMLAAALFAAGASHAQAPQSGPWIIEHSGTTAGLRGIHAVGGGVAWASGTNGTVLRTEDGGYMWQSCALPPRAEKLDFRGIWAWDSNTAIVMSSGPGDQSRLYKTTDGCAHWKLLFTNPDAANGTGFWDDILFLDRNRGILVGDPPHSRPEVNSAGNSSSPIRKTRDGGRWIVDDPPFRIWVTRDGGDTWVPVTAPSIPSPGENLYPLPREGIFAASNSSVVALDGHVWMGTSGPRVLGRQLGNFDPSAGLICGTPDPVSGLCPIAWMGWQSSSPPLASGTEASGVFSLAFMNQQQGVAVGGDYQKPNESRGTAAWTADGGHHWTAASKSPHGYRSAVVWDAADKVWIAAGTNGSDVSHDGGRTWQPLDNGNWNALGLPWVVGPKGRIGKLVSLK